MEYLEELKENLCRELERYAHKTDMSSSELNTVHILTDTIKNIHKITCLDESYSMRGNSRNQS